MLVLKDCTTLGSSGFPFATGQKVSVAFVGSSVTCSSGEQLAKFALVEVLELVISGPGTVVTGGGFAGGGFGIEGALQGMAIAGVLNALTTKKQMQTFITIATNFGELHLHYGLMEPGALRIYLADVFVQLRRSNSQWTRDRLQLIADQLEAGLITQEEADSFMARVTGPAQWPDPEAAKRALLELEEQAFAAAPKGMCPSCDKIIPLASETCPYCRANFGEYASWKVLPIT